MRLLSASKIDLDERWKSILKSNELKQISAVAGALNGMYGFV
jgi:hypothetical protein